nr:hypothetical protein CFP56_19599 [Quercus suber]
MVYGLDSGDIEDEKNKKSRRQLWMLSSHAVDVLWPARQRGNIGLVERLHRSLNLSPTGSGGAQAMIKWKKNAIFVGQGCIAESQSLMKMQGCVKRPNARDDSATVVQVDPSICGAWGGIGGSGRCREKGSDRLSVSPRVRRFTWSGFPRTVTPAAADARSRFTGTGFLLLRYQRVLL